MFAALGDLLYAAAAALFSVTLVPLAVLLFRRKRRLKAFGAQFPEAIDIIVRSLRAGHPTPVAIAMVARELPDPVGSEFGMVADEITYGADLEGALRNMVARTGHEDLPLFVTSVVDPGDDRRQSQPDPRQPLEGDPRALQDAAQDPRPRRRGPRFGA